MKSKQNQRRASPKKGGLCLGKEPATGAFLRLPPNECPIGNRLGRSRVLPCLRAQQLTRRERRRDLSFRDGARAGTVRMTVRLVEQGDRRVGVLVERDGD